MGTGWKPASSPGWRLMDEEDRNAVWERFDIVFAFSPSVHFKDWPVFAEPTPSVTFEISHFWDIYRKDESLAANLDRDLHFNALSAFRLCVPRGESMYALDWQHPCYWFYPHRAKPDEEWGVEVIPNGDYYNFIAKDFSFGTLGQPWEGSICVFGQVLLDAFEHSQPLLFDRVLRRNGEFVVPTRNLYWKERKGDQPNELYVFSKTFFDKTSTYKTRVEISIIKEADQYKVVTTIESPETETLKVVNAGTASLAYALERVKHERGLWDYKMASHPS